jgi:hypothetical protein
MAEFGRQTRRTRAIRKDAKEEQSGRMQKKSNQEECKRRAVRKNAKQEQSGRMQNKSSQEECLNANRFAIASCLSNCLIWSEVRLMGLEARSGRLSLFTYDRGM